GAGLPSVHSTCSICAPYFPSPLSTADVALLVHSLPSGRVQPGAATAGSGNHACAFAAGLTISTRVVTSYLRQTSGVGVNGALAKAPRGNAASAVSAAPPCKNSRLFMPSSPGLEHDCRMSKPALFSRAPP